MKIAYTMNGLIGGFTNKNYVSSSDEDSRLILRYVNESIEKFIKPYCDVDFFYFQLAYKF